MAVIKIPIHFILGKVVSPRFLDLIFLIHAGNEDIDQSSDDVEFLLNPTTEYGVSCIRDSVRLSYGLDDSCMDSSWKK